MCNSIINYYFHSIYKQINKNQFWIWENIEIPVLNSMIYPPEWNGWWKRQLSIQKQSLTKQVFLFLLIDFKVNSEVLCLSSSYSVPYLCCKNSGYMCSYLIEIVKAVDMNQTSSNEANGSDGSASRHNDVLIFHYFIINRVLNSLCKRFWEIYRITL